MTASNITITNAVNICFTTVTLKGTSFSIISVTSVGNICNQRCESVIFGMNYWNTSPIPTISDSRTFDGSGLGGFLSLISNLTPGVNYYLRANATLSCITVYLF